MANGIVKVKMTADQLGAFRVVLGDPFAAVSDGALVSVTTTQSKFDAFAKILQNKPKGMGMGDYKSWLADRLLPAEGFIEPYGVADFPVNITPDPATPQDLLGDIKDQLVAQKTSRQPLLRALSVTSVGQTLDWSALGRMARIMIRNKGGSSAWIAFDQEGPSVVAATSDLSWELQAQEALSIELCDFQKIGCRCAAAGTATVHAIAFPPNSGDFGGAVT